MKLRKIALLNLLMAVAAVPALISCDDDEPNTMKGTPEDFANHNYEGTYMFTNINVTEDYITIYGGQDLGEAGRMSILCVDGRMYIKSAALPEWGRG